MTPPVATVPVTTTPGLPADARLPSPDGADDAAPASFAAVLDLAVVAADLLGESGLAANDPEMTEADQAAIDALALAVPADPAALRFAAFLPDASRLVPAPAARKSPAAGETGVALPAAGTGSRTAAAAAATPAPTNEGRKTADARVADSPVAAAPAGPSVASPPADPAAVRAAPPNTVAVAPATHSAGPVSAHVTPGESAAVAKPAPLHVAAPLGSPGFAPELATRVHYAASRGLESVSIEIVPPQLGPLEIEIRVTDGKTQIHFTADNPVAREAIVDAIPRLRERFAEQGIALGGTSVGEQLPRRDAGDAERQARGDGGPRTARDNAPETADASPLALTRVRLPRLVDIFA